ncbi:hypothetical protein HMI01_29030 [Halolactibacillus miurensis]|uniref:Uncharacterized protein n=1 Tax=Halolactibacillus miurensis TaxID=306541 RepID=A0ABQ0W2Q9_9BACI|nr:hypothetical protein HMI01_29030 [Halolactibacillus miurensis]
MKNFIFLTAIIIVIIILFLLKYYFEVIGSYTLIIIFLAITIIISFLRKALDINFYK